MSKEMPVPAKTHAALLGELRQLIEQARQHVAQTANSTLTMLYWRVGERVLREVLKNSRAEYGEEILQTLSAKLTRDYGRGFAEKSLRRMVQFAEVFSNENIVATLSRELTLCERKGWAEEACVYNELVTAWSAIEQAAGEAGVVGSQGQLEI